jgi:hypothetical protein
MKTDKITYETESAYADFRKITIEFHGDSSTSDVVEICRRLLVAAGHHPDNVEFDKD